MVRVRLFGWSECCIVLLGGIAGCCITCSWMGVHVYVPPRDVCIFLRLKTCIVVASIICCYCCALAFPREVRVPDVASLCRSLFGERIMLFSAFF